MNFALNSLAVLLATFGAFMVSCNYGAVIVSTRNRRRGIDHHSSMVSVVPQLCLLLAYAVSCAAPSKLIPSWLLLAVGLADLSFWGIASLPILFLSGRPPFRKSHTKKPDRGA